MMGFGALGELALGEVTLDAVGVSGQTLTVNASISSGSAAGGALSSGVTLSDTVNLATGSASGGAVTAGATLSDGATLQDGSASGGATVDGQTLLAITVLVSGTATGRRRAVPPTHAGFNPRFREPQVQTRSVRVLGQLLTVDTVLLPGQATTGASSLGQLLGNWRVDLLSGRVRIGVIALGSPFPPARLELVSGSAEGFDGYAHDNDFLLY